MRATFYTDEQLVKSVRQLEKDWKRLYPDGDTDNPLYEGLQYERYLCKKRGLVYCKRLVSGWIPFCSDSVHNS